MSLLDLTASAVQKAIEEFDRLGREPFLKKYGFGKARGYILLKDRKYYDSKVIAGAAHGYLPGRSALKPNEFSASEATVEKTLEGLGFTVVGPDAEHLPLPGGRTNQTGARME
jgi:5-methylcytosine-specific restriction protein A